MSNNIKKESNVPAPTANNSQRGGKDGGGNTPYPSGAEKHDQSKATRITASQNRSGSGVGPEQPVRQDGGNTTVTGESHDQSKAKTIPESSRW